MLRRVLYWVPWLALFWIEAPALLPESIAERAYASYFVSALRFIAFALVVLIAYRGRAVDAGGAGRKLVFGLVAVAGLVFALFMAIFLPTARFDGCAPGPLAKIDTCHHWVAGFSPDIPYYSLAKGPLEASACEMLRPGVKTATLTTHREQHAFVPAECPALVSGHCWTTEWRTPNGSDYFVAVAAGDACRSGIWFDGRGRPARERWQRTRGF